MADNEKQESRDSTGSKVVRSARLRLRKALPTDGANFSKQLDGFCVPLPAASGAR